MKISIKEVEELADILIRIEYPTYENAISGLKKAILNLKAGIKDQLILWLNEREIEIEPEI